MNKAIVSLTKKMLRIYIFVVFICIFLTPSSAPTVVNHYLDSLYPIAQNHFWHHINTELSGGTFVMLLISSIIYFCNIISVGRWLLIFTFVLGEASDFITKAYIVYGFSLFFKELSDILEGVLLILLLLQNSKIVTEKEKVVIPNQLAAPTVIENIQPISPVIHAKNTQQNPTKKKQPFFIRLLFFIFILIFVASNWLFTLSIFSNTGRNVIDYPKLHIVTTLNHYIYHYPLLIPAILVLSQLSAVKTIFKSMSEKTKMLLMVVFLTFFTFLCYNNALQFICSGLSLIGLIVVYFFSRTQEKKKVTGVIQEKIILRNDRRI